jgi:hypothetical protein
MAGPVTNPLALLAGALAKLEIGDWTANYATSSFVDFGALQDITLETEVASSSIEADNVLAELGEYNTKQIVGIKAKLMEMNLERISTLMGKPIADAVVTKWVTGTTDGTAILGIGALPAVPYKTIKLTVDPVALTPAYTADATSIYTTLVYTFARCASKVKTSEAFKKNGVWVFPFEFKAFWDSTCPAKSEIFKITQTKPK